MLGVAISDASKERKAVELYVLFLMLVALLVQG